MPRVLVEFSAKSINKYYNLEPINSIAYDRLHETPNYYEVPRMLTNGQGKWKLNNEGHVVHFKAKHLAYIPKVCHHFITSRLIPTTNVCEMTAKRVLLNYAIIQDILFDVSQVIEDAILYNKDAKMNLRHLFLIYGLCKQAGVSLEDNEAWIHSIKVIMVKKDKLGVPRPEEVTQMRKSLGLTNLGLGSRRCSGRGGIVIHPTPIPITTTIPGGGPYQSFHYTGGPGP